MAKLSSKTLAKGIENRINELAKMVDEAEFNEEVKKYLETISKFHNYSINNQWLISMNRSNATKVAGYHAWQKLGRHVNKGEAGIPIFAPIIRKSENEAGKEIKNLVGFKVVYVFDLSQTTGKELNELNVWKSRGKSQELETALKSYAEKLGLNIIIDKNLGGAEGMINRNNEIHLTAESGTKTLAHEIAHFLAGHTKENGHETPHKIRELEAEATAYTVCITFGLEPENSQNYLFLTGLNAEDLKKSFDSISKLAKEMITEIEGIMK